MSREQALLHWLQTLPAILHLAQDRDSLSSFDSLFDGTVLYSILQQLAPAAFPGDALRRADSAANWLQRVNNLIKLIEAMHVYLATQQQSVALDIDAALIGRQQSRAELCKLLQLLLHIAVTSEQAALFVEAIVNELPAESQAMLKLLIEETQALVIDETLSESGSSSSVDRDNELDELHVRVAELQVSADALQASLDAALGEKRQLLVVVTQLEQQLRDADKTLAETRARLDAAEKLVPLVDESAADKAALASAEQEIEQLRVDAQLAEAELLDARRAKELRATLEKQLRDARDEAEVARDAVERAQVAESALLRMREKLQQYEALQERLDSANEQLSLVAAPSALSAAHSNASTAAAEEVGRLRAQLSTMQTKLDARETECQRLQHELTQALLNANELQSMEMAGGAAIASADNIIVPQPEAPDQEAREALEKENLALKEKLKEALLAAQQAAAITESESTTPTPTTTTTTTTTTQTSGNGDAADVEKINQLTADKARLEGYLKAAKQMIRDLRIKQKSEQEQQDSEAAAANAAALAERDAQLAERDETIASLTKRLAEARKLAQIEQQRMMTAFYEAGLERLKDGVRAASAQASFLQRQRANATKRDRL